MGLNRFVGLDATVPITAQQTGEIGDELFDTVRTGDRLAFVPRGVADEVNGKYRTGYRPDIFLDGGAVQEQQLVGFSRARDDDRVVVVETVARELLSDEVDEWIEQWAETNEVARVSDDVVDLRAGGDDPPLRLPDPFGDEDRLGRGESELFVVADAIEGVLDGTKQRVTAVTDDGAAREAFRRPAALGPWRAGITDTVATPALGARLLNRASRDQNASVDEMADRLDEFAGTLAHKDDSWAGPSRDGGERENAFLVWLEEVGDPDQQLADDARAALGRWGDGDESERLFRAYQKSKVQEQATDEREATKYDTDGTCRW